MGAEISVIDGSLKLLTLLANKDAEAIRRKVTYQKWRHDFDTELKTVTWMSCETETSSGVKRLKCSI